MEELRCCVEKVLQLGRRSRKEISSCSQDAFEYIFEQYPFYSISCFSKGGPWCQGGPVGHQGECVQLSSS
jgi:hypothetical protein